MYAATFSIAAFDPRERAWGVAVASRFFAVGALISHAEAGAGAISTQALINPAYGVEGLALLRSGHSAPETIDILTQGDPDSAQRQVGIVDGEGRPASFTGPDCLAVHGIRLGDHHAIQGNMLASSRCLDAMAAAYEQHASTSFEMRLLHTMQAGQRAGGDRRGQQSAVIKVVQRQGGYQGYDVRMDLRVDDHATPLDELERLMGLHSFYFGRSDDNDMLTVDEPLRREIGERISSLGYAHDDVEAALKDWICQENLEERYEGLERIDPLVLEHLRASTK